LRAAFAVLTMQNALLDLSAHTVRLAKQTDFAGWRDAARRLALGGVRPEEVAWVVSGDESPLPSPSSSGLFRGSAHAERLAADPLQANDTLLAPPSTEADPRNKPEDDGRNAGPQLTVP